MEYTKNPDIVSPGNIRVEPGNRNNAIRALLIQLEFPTWKAAKSWGYSGHFGLEEGLHANNVDTFILPAWGLIETDSHLSWLPYAQEILHNQHFDQVWLWLVHCEYPQSFLEWVSTLAPVRVGCLYESLSYTREECLQNSKLENRREDVCQQMQGLTHIICSDECDASYIQERGIARAIWSPTFVPGRFVNDEYTPPPHSNAAFFGALYSEERRQWLQQSNLNNLLARPASPEDATNYPLQFDRLHEKTLDYLNRRLPVTQEVLRQYVDELRVIRQGTFNAWMNGLRQWNGLVNLPSFGKVYTSRVAESMAAGSPAISWDVPNRPRNKSLFEDGKDILLYQRNQPDQLAQHLLNLQRQPDFARTLVDNAREKIKRYHTAEVRAWQILNWIETGIEPKYCENVGGGKLGDDVVTGFAQADRQDSPSNPRDVPGRSHITSEEFSGLDDPRRKPPRVSSQKCIAPVTFDGTGLVRSSENKEGLSDMSSEQLNQRNQEDQFYTELFVHSGSWSTPTPNTDETMRWGKIKVFLPEIIKHLQQVDNQPVRILDVGCGRGWLTNLLSGYGYCEGIEPVESVVEYGRRLFPHLTLHVGFPDGLLTGDNFQPYDLIVTSEVIEHIPHAQKTEFVHTLQKLLKPNGAVILTTPRREVWEQWRTVSTPNQPIEDWITEPELFDLFQGKGFNELGRERIYFDLPKFQYVTDPTEGEDVDSSIIPLYQVWAFGIGVLFQDLHDFRGGTTSLQSFTLGETSISVTKHAGSMVLSQNSEEIPPSRNPLVSVIVPTFNRPNTLKVALQSILQQTFTDYEIIVINDAGIDVEDIAASVNERNNVTSIRHGKNRGLAAARNSGLGVARGKYIAYLDDDDRFLPNHLETLVGYLEKSSYHVAYSDAWRVFEKQENEHYVEKKRDVPYSKDFNPETLLITNYFPVLCMMHEKSCLDKTGVFDESLTTHEDWDLWIRLSRHYTFAHLNKITAEFTWRMDRSSMSSNIPKDFLRTKQLIYQKYAEYFRLQPSLIPMRDQELRNLESQVNSQTFKCSIIIPVFNKMELTQQCLMYLADVTKETSYEVVIVDNHSTDGTSKFLATLGGDVQIIRNATNLGFAKACNQGAQAAKGEYLVFLNNDTIPLQGWLEPLVHEVVSNPEVAVVGSKLLYPDKTIQHAGVAFSRYNQLPYHIFNGVPENFPAVNIRKEFQAVTAACMLVRREVFEEVGGFDEAFINGFEDVDLCLKIGQIRKKVVYQPKSSLYHLESQTPGRKKHDDLNAERLATRWKNQWLVDEDIIAYQGGFIIQYNFIDEQPKVQMVPRNNVAQASSWQQVVDLQQLLIQQKRQPLAKMANSQKIRQLLVDINGWPSDIGILEWLGGVCERLDCEQEAIQCWEKILTIGDHPDARLGLARAAIKAGDLIEAQQHARLGLARAAIKAGDLIEAQQHLDVMRSSFPEQVEGFSLQGIVYMQNRKFLEASCEFEHAITLNSADFKSQLGLGQAYLGLGQHLKAWEIFESSMLSGPDGLETLNGLIQAGTALENWDALATHLVRYVERNPANCDMRFALAGVEFRADHVEKAREQLTWLKLIKPDYEGLEELETLLQSAQPQGNCVSTR